mmetsp:Transcript_18711/g.51528  ORF Transcript_18711/g.51528 Transcript_18711/m.51528 type:complete len:268 (+) Transcript_18711:648-1451(+)
MLLREGDDFVSKPLDLGLWHVARLQQVLKHPAEGKVLATVACDEDHCNTGLRPRRSQGAHHGEGNPAKTRVVVTLVVRKLLVEPLHQLPSIRYLVELMHEDTWQGCVLRPEPKQHAAYSRLDFVNQGSEGVRMIEHSPFAAQTRLILRKLIKALLGMRVLVEKLERVLGSPASHALRPELHLPRHLRRRWFRARPLGFVADDRIICWWQLITRVEDPQLPPFARADIDLHGSLRNRKIDAVVLPTCVQLERSLALGQSLANLPGLLG